MTYDTSAKCSTSIQLYLFNFIGITANSKRQNIFQISKIKPLFHCSFGIPPAGWRLAFCLLLLNFKVGFFNQLHTLFFSLNIDYHEKNSCNGSAVIGKIESLNSYCHLNIPETSNELSIKKNRIRLFENPINYEF